MLTGQVALITAALFTGAAIYVSIAEQPARLMLDDRALLAQWKPSYAHGALMQASLAAASGLLGLLAWWIAKDWRWAAGVADPGELALHPAGYQADQQQAERYSG